MFETGWLRGLRNELIMFLDEINDICEDPKSNIPLLDLIFEQYNENFFRDQSLDPTDLQRIEKRMSGYMMSLLSLSKELFLVNLPFMMECDSIGPNR